MTDRHRSFAPDGGVMDAGARDPTDGDGDEVEPVEVLVGLAEDGEIEPWDIDIVAVTDAYLARLDEADLRTSGRALFYAAVLLRMKSEALLDQADEEEAANTLDDAAMRWEDDAWAMDEAPGGDPISALESEMERRLDRKSARGTPETLEGLVRELRAAERERRWKSSRTYDTSESPRGYQRGRQTLDYRADDASRAPGEPSVAEVTGTAHSEDMEEIIAAVRAAVTERFDAGRDAVLFAEIDDVAGSRILTYLGVLFLAHRGIIRLEQDQLFGDLWLRDPATVVVETP